MQLAHIKAAIPLFVPCFVAMVLARSFGDWYVESHTRDDGGDDVALSQQQWRAVVALVGSTLGAKVLLGTAMASVGLQLSPDKLKGLGVRPFAVGMTAATTMAVIGGIATTVVARRTEAQPN